MLLRSVLLRANARHEKTLQICAMTILLLNTDHLLSPPKGADEMWKISLPTHPEMDLLAESAQSTHNYFPAIPRALLWPPMTTPFSPEHKDFKITARKTVFSMSQKNYDYLWCYLQKVAVAGLATPTHLASQDLTASRLHTLHNCRAWCH